MKFGVVADDITGANDIGVMFAKWGYETHVYAHEHFLEHYQNNPDVCIVDTNSRLDSRDTAYNKVFAATQALVRLGCKQFHKKTCSVFRGNIGAEFDAMLDALGQDFAVVVLGFPKNGRTTVDAIHYVRGVRLEESEFRHDPAHPMTHSNLVDILQSQTARRVGLIDYRVIQSGRLRNRLAEMRGEYNYVILDVTHQEDLKRIAEAVQDVPVLCGSSAIAEDLPAFWSDVPQHPKPLNILRREGLGILCAAGSLMPQTSAQIACLREQGAATFPMNALRLFDEREAEIHYLVDSLTEAMTSGIDGLVHTASSPDDANEVKREGALQGLSNTDVSRLVSESLAEVVAQVVERTGQNRLLIAGGETSAAVCRRLGVYGLRVWKEIQPGLPSCASLTEPLLLLVLKSGSFGTPDFFERALEHLKSE
jgi:uncharacterized protein YgbK (DUF1537 family)